MAFAFIGTMTTGCKKAFLDEKSVTTLTTDDYYKTAAGFEELLEVIFDERYGGHEERKKAVEKAASAVGCFASWDSRATIRMSRGR